MSTRNWLIFAGCLIMFCAKANPVGDGDDHTVTPPPPPPVATYIDSVPAGCAHRYAISEYVDLPAGFSAMTPWFQAVHNSVLGSTSHVEVDYVRTYSEVVSGNTLIRTLIVSDEYDTWSTSSGGLYTKWFTTDDHTPMPATIVDGVLNFSPSDSGDRVWHWWPNRIPYSETSGKFVVEVRLRLTGAACVQIGADWWRDMNAWWNGYNVNNKEVGASRWYFASPNWQTITFSNK